MARFMCIRKKWCTMGRKQAGRGSVMLMAMFSWEVDVTLTHNLPKNCCRPHTTLSQCKKNYKIVQKWYEEHKCKVLGLQSPQISIQFTIYGICWINKSDPWRPNLCGLLLMYWCQIPQDASIGLVVSMPQCIRACGTCTILGRWF